jgi:hypothetical protein
VSNPTARRSFSLHMHVWIWAFSGFNALFGRFLSFSHLLQTLLS